MKILGQPEPVIEKHGRTHRVKIVPKGISGEAVPVQILYGDTPIKGSPFILKIARSSFPENVKILNANTGTCIASDPMTTKFR